MSSSCKSTLHWGRFLGSTRVTLSIQVGTVSLDHPSEDVIVIRTLRLFVDSPEIPDDLFHDTSRSKQKKSDEALEMYSYNTNCGEIVSAFSRVVVLLADKSDFSQVIPPSSSCSDFASLVSDTHRGKKRERDFPNHSYFSDGLTHI